MNNLTTTKLVGNNITTVAEFKDINGAIIVPANVVLKYKDPSGAVTVASITQSGTKYTSTVFLNLAGDWTFRWECTGNIATSEEFTVQVLPSKV